jgi:hypothetical protein
LRVAALVAANTPTPTRIFTFTAPLGATTHFIGYSVFSDGTDASLQEFIPKVNRERIFPFQGDPNNNFRINLGLGPDVSNAHLILCQLTLNPREVLTWDVINNHGVDVAMGIRMVGYVDATQKRLNARSGG